MSDDGGVDPRGAGRASVEGGLVPSSWAQAAREVDLDPAELSLAFEVLGWVPEALRTEGLAALVAALRLAQARGSTRLPLSGPPLDAHLNDLQAPEGRVAAARLRESAGAFAPLSGPPEGYQPLVVEGGYLYSQRLHALERRVAAAVRDRLAVEDDDPLPRARAVAEVRAAQPQVGGRPLALSDEQLHAVEEACRGRLTLISGEPGTGKTSIVVSILRVLARLGVPLTRIALAAPTGKAADRMRRSIEATLASLSAPGFADRALLQEGPRSQTLHRLLGFSPSGGHFRHHEANPLAEQVVIVDESSMIDVAMVDRLLRALAPDARLILLGDAEQLPSVDAGAVFRDLCEALQGTGRVVRLTRSYRMDPKDPSGRHVLVTARQVQSGDPAPLFGPRGLRPRHAGDALQWEGVEHWMGELDPLLELWEARFATPPEATERAWEVDEDGVFTPESVAGLDALFVHVERARILCLTRARETGIHAVNARFHRRRSEARGLSPSIRWTVGEPVLVMRNDYERGLFNGDQGVVLWVDGARSGRRVCAVFRRADGFAAFPVETVAPILELAHAVTVHKAQGSEHDVVALILPKDPIPLLTREMLYTAITRARRGVVIVGSRAIVEEGVRRRVERSSGLAEFVRGGL